MAVVGGEGESSVDPWCVEKRKQQSGGPEEIGTTNKLIIVGKKTSWV